MIPMLALTAVLLAQAPPPAAKTVEDRLKELDVKIAALEKKQRDLAEENGALEKQIADGRAAREKFLRQTASAWVRRYAEPAGLSANQASELEEVWYGWSKMDLEKPADGAAWKAREEVLKGRLSADQAVRLARRVREELEQSAKRTLGFLTQSAKLGAGTSAALESAVMARVSIPEGQLLPQAHPEGSVSWVRLVAAAEECLPDLSPAPTEQEQAALRKILEQWKPRRP